MELTWLLYNQDFYILHYFSSTYSFLWLFCSLILPIIHFHSPNWILKSCDEKTLYYSINVSQHSHCMNSWCVKRWVCFVVNVWWRCEMPVVFIFIRFYELSKSTLPQFVQLISFVSWYSLQLLTGLQGDLSEYLDDFDRKLDHWQFDNGPVMRSYTWVHSIIERNKDMYWQSFLLAYCHWYYF